MISLKIGGIIVAAFIAGAFVASPELRAYAANTIASSDIIDESILSQDIKNGEVKSSDIGTSAVINSKIAPNAVTYSKINPNTIDGSKIKDGAIGYADVSRNLIAVEHRDDCNCGGTGWDPDGTRNAQLIFDDRITSSSVIAVTSIGNAVLICSTYGPSSGAGPGTGFDSPRVFVKCTTTIPNGAAINYAIFNNPAYG